MGDVDWVYRQMEADVSKSTFYEAVDQRLHQMGGIADRETAAMLVADQFQRNADGGAVDRGPDIEQTSEREWAQEAEEEGTTGSTDQAKTDTGSGENVVSQPATTDNVRDVSDEDTGAEFGEENQSANEQEESTGQSRPDGVKPKFDDPSAYEEQYPPDWDARRRHVYQRDDYTCANCATRSGPYATDGGVPLHAHHIVPLSRGGTNRIDNLTTVCEACHNKIHTHDITGESQASTKTPSGRNTQRRTQRQSVPSASEQSRQKTKAQQGREDEAFLGGVLQFIVLVPLYVFSLEAVIDLFAGGSVLWGGLGVIVCLLYVAIAAGYETRTFGCHAIWGVLLVAFGGSIAETAVVLGAPLLVGIGLSTVLELRAESG